MTWRQIRSVLHKTWNSGEVYYFPSWLPPPASWPVPVRPSTLPSLDLVLLWVHVSEPSSSSNQYWWKLIAWEAYSHCPHIILIGRNKNPGTVDIKLRATETISMGPDFLLFLALPIKNCLCFSLMKLHFLSSCCQLMWPHQSSGLNVFHVPWFPTCISSGPLLCTQWCIFFLTSESHSAGFLLGRWAPLCTFRRLFSQLVTLALISAWNLVWTGPLHPWLSNTSPLQSTLRLWHSLSFRSCPHIVSSMLLLALQLSFLTTTAIRLTSWLTNRILIPWWPTVTRTLTIAKPNLTHFNFASFFSIIYTGHVYSLFL